MAHVNRRRRRGCRRFGTSRKHELEAAAAQTAEPAVSIPQGEPCLDVGSENLDKRASEVSRQHSDAVVVVDARVAVEPAWNNRARPETVERPQARTDPGRRLDFIARD